MVFQIPVLLISFNRPRHTRLVLQEIKKKRPAYLYVFQDSPPDENHIDIEKCLAVRKVFEEQIDWDCELNTLYSEKNLGCGPGPAAAISWFFESVEMGLIIEDDAVPHQDFFKYAETLLYKYRNDVSVRAIGSMKIEKKQYGNASYYFSMMNRTLCAWATWRRAWKDFDYHMGNITEIDLFKALTFYNVTLREKEYWYERLLEIQKDGLANTSWDQQFWMSIWLNHGMGISPNVNLSTNIGFGNDSTHTFDKNSLAASLPTESLDLMVHPQEKRINRKADLNFHKLYFEPWEYGFSGLKRLPFRINKRIKRLLGIHGSWFNK